MSTPETQATPAPTLQEPKLQKALASSRPPRPSALSAALTFGWRGMLKVKHVPEQLLDVTITPVMFVLMFTYRLGGRVPALPAARHPRHGRAVHDRLLRRRAEHRPDQGRRRPLPLAADLEP